MARKASMWAKAAGEYYRKNKGKNGIESFTDVLKSSDFKNSYHAKYGKTVGKKASKGRATKRYMGGENGVESQLPADLPQPPGELASSGGEATPAATQAAQSTTAPAPIVGGTVLGTSITTKPRATGGRRKRRGGKKTAKRRR
jgi:hypothetical protein